MQKATLCYKPGMSLHMTPRPYPALVLQVTNAGVVNSICVILRAATNSFPKMSAAVWPVW